MSCWDISGSPSRLDTKKLSKTQIFKLSKMIIKCIKIIFRIQRSLLKSFLVFWGPISAKISFWKKLPKICPILPKNDKNHVFFKFQLWFGGAKWPIFGRKIFQKFRLTPNSYQNFFYHPNSKIGENISKQLPPPPPKSTFFLGGVELFLWQRDRSVSTCTLFFFGT